MRWALTVEYDPSPRILSKLKSSRFFFATWFSSMKEKKESNTQQTGYISALSTHVLINHNNLTESFSVDDVDMVVYQ